MSAPTLRADDLRVRLVERATNTRPATPADVRLWLLDQGAEERQWCETHDSNAKYATEDGGYICEQGVDPDNLACRMVSVLVYKEEK